VLLVKEEAETFHARYSAKGKMYEYRILNRPYRSALNRQWAWHIPKLLNVSAMEQAAQLLVGNHDFSSFQGSQTDNENPACTIERFTLTWDDPILTMHIQADRFLKQMVRAMVGTLVEIGQGKRLPTDILHILHDKDRRSAGKTAPPHGLYLVKVIY
jgi:tRNA pseudouridine38-40 synthase